MIQKAIEYAIKAHEGQCRKSTTIPYIVHPIEVGIILSRYGFEEEIVAAGILHDVLEDTEITLEDLKRDFGEMIAKLVWEVSEDEEVKGPSTWEKRKTTMLEYLTKEASMEAKVISCADKISNLTSLKETLIKDGEETWKIFNSGYENQKWYYQNLIHALKPGCNHPIYEEFVRRVEEIFKDVQEE